MSESGELASYTELVDVLARLPVLLREARRSRRLSMQAAARQIGCSTSAVHRVEHSTGEASLYTAIAILRWLDAGGSTGGEPW